MPKIQIQLEKDTPWGDYKLTKVKEINTKLKSTESAGQDLCSDPVPASPSATYIITCPAITTAALPTTHIQLHTASQQQCLTTELPKARPLSAQVKVPPPRRAMDAHTQKLHRRMIKNRMSASLSRLKKKDELESLQERVRQLDTDNARLRELNQQLERRTAQLAAEVERLRVAQAPASPPASPSTSPTSPRRPMPRRIKERRRRALKASCT